MFKQKNTSLRRWQLPHDAYSASRRRFKLNRRYRIETISLSRLKNIVFDPQAMQNPMHTPLKWLN
jgi:hypothetical protein